MKTVNEVLKETGISYPVLNRLKELGIIPKPSRKGLGNRRGVVGVYEDNVIEIIKAVKAEQARGRSLAQIAEQLRNEKAEIKTLELRKEYLIPWEKDDIKSYLNAYLDFHEWIDKQIEEQMPGYELDSVELEKISKNNQFFLKPSTIKLKIKKNL